MSTDPQAADDPGAAWPVREADPDFTAERSARERGTLDLGLLVLRLALGTLLLIRGSRRLSWLGGGVGIKGFEDELIRAGIARAQLFAMIVSISDIVVGVLLIVGLLTPLAAAAAVAMLVDAWAMAQAATPGIQLTGEHGVGFVTMTLLVAVAICLTGPGSLAFDRTFRWASTPRLGSLLLLLAGIALGVGNWIWLNGTNPFA